MTMFLEALNIILSEGLKITLVIHIVVMWRKHQSSKQNNLMLKAIAKAVGVECVERNGLLPSMARKLSISSWAARLSVQHADAYTARELTIISKENREMKEYLKKIGSRKFQAFLLTTFTHLSLMIGYILDVNDVQEQTSAYTPLFIGLSQLIAGAVYKWVEGSIDKAKFNQPYNDVNPGDTGPAE